MTCEEVRPLLVPYLLGDLQPELDEQVDAHLEACEGCRRALHQADEGILAFLDAVPEETPKLAAAKRLTEALHGPDAAQPDSPTHSRLGELPKRRPTRWGWNLAAGLLIVSLGLNGWLLYRTSSLDRRTDELMVRQKYLHQELAAASQALSWIQESQVPVKQASWLLTATDASPGSQGTLQILWEGDSVVCVLSVEGLPELSRDQVYQVWLIESGERTNAGVFTVDGAGNGLFMFQHQGPFSYDALGITLEPDPMGTSPRGQKVLGVTLTGS